MCYLPLCYSRATSIRNHWRRRDVVCACAVRFWMVGDGGQLPFVCSERRHSHHFPRLLRKEPVVVAATYLMRPVEAECSGEWTRLFCSPPREDPTTGKRLTRVSARCLSLLAYSSRKASPRRRLSREEGRGHARGALIHCRRVSREREAFSRHKAVGTSEEQEKSQDDCLALRKAARADGLRSRIMHGRNRLVTLGQMDGEGRNVGARRRADSR